MTKIEIGGNVYTFRRGKWSGGRAETRRLLALATESARATRPTGSYEPDQEHETLLFLRAAKMKFRIVAEVPEDYSTSDPHPPAAPPAAAIEPSPPAPRVPRE